MKMNVDALALTFTLIAATLTMATSAAVYLRT